MSVFHSRRTNRGKGEMVDCVGTDPVGTNPRDTIPGIPIPGFKMMMVTEIVSFALESE